VFVLFDLFADKQHIVNYYTNIVIVYSCRSSQGLTTKVLKK